MSALRAPTVTNLHLENIKLKLQSQNPKPSKSLTSNPTNSPASATTTRRLFTTSLALFYFIKHPDSSIAVPTYDPVTQAEQAESLKTSQRLSEAIELLERGRDLQAKGDFNLALDCFTQVVERYKEFAFSDYARVGRALALYELGNRDEAIVEMEDVSISLKGYPEVHAALAAALYADKHAPILAENQFTIATLLDPHYTDLSYVRDTKHWPPSLVSSLKNFLSLS